MKKIFMSILACGLLTIGLCGCVPSNTPEDIAEVAAKAMISNDFDKFVDYIYVKEGTSDEEEKQGKERLSAMLKAKKGSKESKYTDCKVISCDLNDEGDKAKVEVEYTLKDGSTKTDKMSVRKGKDGKWGVVKRFWCV